MQRIPLILLTLGMTYGQVDYGTEIQTMLDNNCTSCHGYSGGLNLTNYDDLMSGGDSGDAIVPGDHENSLLWQRVESGEMPGGGNEDLTSDEIDLIATWIDEGALETPQVDVTGLFFSEYAEGSSNNKYFEIYNGTGETVSLDDFVILGNYNGNPWSETFTFDTGATIDVGDVYVIASSDADATITDLADETHAYADPWYITAFNGNDVRALAQIDGTDTTIIDMIGTLEGGDPGAGWDVAGVTDATANHTLLRQSNVMEGNGGDWNASAGTSADNSEWIVLDQDTWDYLGSHPHELTDDISIQIVSPEDGATLFSDQVTIEFFVANFTIGSTGDGVDGHVHYMLDDNNAVMHYSTDPISLEDISVGDHVFHIWLVDSEHGALDPFVGDTLNFSISETGTITSIYDIQYVTDPDSDDASPLNGEEVTIQGVVTAEFWGSDQYRYMHVQDDDGPWNGIVCFEYDGWHDFDWVDASGNSHPGPGEGDEVTLTGTVEEYYNLTELASVTSGIVHGESEEELTPSFISISEIGEAYEGCLIAVEDVVVTNPDLGYGEWEFGDGELTARCDDKWNYFYYPVEGHQLADIEGVLDYNYDNYKLQPRLARDVVEEDLTRIQRIQQVLHSDLMKAGEDASSDISYMLGDTVTMEGIVTMPTGLSYAGSGVKFIFADVNGGPWSAVLSYDPDSSAFPTLFEGDLIQATGYVYEYTTGPANMTELFITEPINIMDFEQPLPVVDTVQTGDLRWPTEAEQWGNVMVRVEDAVVTGNDFQYEVFAADDGSGSVLVDDDSDSIAAFFEVLGPPPVGSLLQSMEGWLYHHYGSNDDSTAYKLCPLYADDMEFGSGPPSISGMSRVPCAPMSSDNEVAVSCVILDNSSISEALVHYTIDGSTYNTVTMSSDDDSVFTGVIPISDVTSNDNSVYYYITATDDGADQSEPKTSQYPYDTDHDQLGFVVTDELGVIDLQYTPWPSGNTRYEGCEVTVSGIVTADTAQYNSGYSSYALQDPGTQQQWAGLVFDTEEVVDITRGEHVSITGLVTDYDPDWLFKFGGNTRLINAQVTIVETLDEPGPTVVSCEDVSQTADEVESYEGVLVKLDNVTISSVNDFDWSITDESGFEALIDDDLSTLEADNLMSTFVEGQELDHVMGIFNYSYGTYKVQIRDVADLGQMVGIDDDVKVNPYDYALHDNFPNPFNPETQIRFSIGSQEDVKLIVYDVVGRQVRTLIKGNVYDPGFHVVNWNGLDDKGQKVPSGLYIYRIKAGSFIADKKMLLVK
ncbi:MAG: c-type cytochrome domain-containing protein [Candidatus Marinimicrobia bacterium]|nr:c-type cytochrome domain-containing protein [Candidatus Neomarinimicrobiota bacterium]